MEFPYQLVAFLENEPSAGEPVYNGENGWYPQIALKRRFKVEGINEDELIEKVAAYVHSRAAFFITTSGLMTPERMPVQVIEVEPVPELMNFHTDFIKFMGSNLQSRYPERDGMNYLPHVTAEYGGKKVIDSAKFVNRNIRITRVWLLKDTESEDSVAYKSFNLG